MLHSSCLVHCCQPIALALAITHAFHEQLDYNLGNYNKDFDMGLTEVKATVAVTETALACYATPWYSRTVLISGIPVGILYYYKRNPVILYIWATSCLALPWALSALVIFAQEHTMGGVILTLVTTAALYKLDILPPELLSEFALAGLCFTSVVTLAAWLSQFSLANIASAIGEGIDQGSVAATEGIGSELLSKVENLL